MREELTPESYKAARRFRTTEPMPFVFVVACNPDTRQPEVFIKVLVSTQKYIVCNALNDRSYMFKDSGLFGYTDNREDIHEHSFNTMQEAYEVFLKFYKD